LANQIVTKTLTGFPAMSSPLGTADAPATSPDRVDDKDLLRDSTSSSPNGSNEGSSGDDAAKSGD